MSKSLLLAASLAALAAPACAQSAGETRLDMAIGGQTLPAMSGGYKAWRYQWPAVYFEARFKGNDVTLAFDDPSNNLNVIVDGRLVAILKKPGKTSYSLHKLGTGPHTIRLEKRSETQYAVGAFKGFFVPAKGDALPAPAFDHAIEFIGDSGTVGYGNTSAYTQCTPDEIFETTDSQQGPGALVGKHFKAAYRVNAFSGLGMVRNYDGREHPKYHMPMLYTRAVFDNPAPDPAKWTPQIIVVAIGGNDTSTALHDDEPWKTREALLADYTKTYVAFVKALRAHNPGAHLLIVSPEAGRAEYAAAVKGVFDTLVADGVARVDLLTLPKTVSDGCNGHPNTRDDADIAKMYTDYIEAHPEYWRGG